MRLSTLGLALAASSWISSPIASAAAGFVVQQKVLFGGAAKSEANLLWHVSEREFRLDVTRGTDTRHFVFNGRTFYACGKLGAKQLEVLKKLSLDDKRLLDSLSQGACQELSSTFAARFFLSPYEAVGDVDLGGGYGTTLQLGEPEITLTGAAETIGGAKCVEVKRAYALTGKDEDKSRRKVNETACNAPTIKWRHAMAREVGMAMIRQPGGQQNFKAMNADLKKNAGMSLRASGTVAGTDAQGKAVNRTFEASTSKAAGQEIAPADVATPKGFEIVDPKNLEAVAAKSKVPAGKLGKGSVAEDVIRSLIIGATF